MTITTSWTTGILPRPHADLAYEELGVGPAVLYAHGAFMSRKEDDRLGSTDWAPVLADGNCLVRYDARGHGESTGRPVPSDYHYPNLGSDLLAVADHIQPDSPIRAIGASMGAAALLHAAVEAPGRFDRLILIIPPTAWADRRAQAAAYLAQADHVARTGKGAMVEAMRTMPAPPALSENPAWPLVPDISEPLLPAVMRGMGESNLPALQEISRLPHPTLILAWADDPVHPTATAHRLATALPHSSLHIAETPADHRAWGTRIAEFLAG